MKEKKDFRKKHPDGATADEGIVLALREVATEDMQVSCAAATLVSQRLGVSMSEVGKALDLGGFFITGCQLGIFGFGKEAITPAAVVAPALEAAMAAALSAGRLPCVAAWALAERFQMSRKEQGQACEALRVKVKPCQLGAF